MKKILIMFRVPFYTLNYIGRVVGCSVFGLIIALTCLVTRQDGFFHEWRKMSTDIKTMEYTTKSQRIINVMLGITVIWFVTMFVKYLNR